MDGLVVCSPCYYSSREPLKFLLDSAKEQDIQVHLYGEGKVFPGWIPIKVNGLREFLKTRDESHVLYTDGADAFFTGELSSIRDMYELAGAPPLLMSAELECYPYYELGPNFPDHGLPNRYPYPNAGQFIGERDYIIDCLDVLEADYYGGNDQGWWQLGIVDGKMNVQLDSGCDLFQTMSGGADQHVSVLDGFVVNHVTGGAPCLMHFNGHSGDIEAFYKEVYK